MSAPVLTLDPGLDPAAHAARLRETGRAHVPGLLAPASAEALHAVLARGTPWSRSINIAGRGAEMPAARFEAAPPDEQQALFERIWAEARDGFQYLFDRFRITETRATGGAVPAGLLAADDFLNGPFLEFVRALSGDDRGVFCDAQATRYLPGHFLTRHDDARGDHGRLFAYVLNLTPEWRADWGGQLQFIGPEGHVAEAFVPAWNALNLFRVPQDHAVSVVAPFAGGERLSITGWVRATR